MATAAQFSALIACDADRLAALVKHGPMDKAQKPAARALLWRLWAVLTPHPEDDGAPATPLVALAELAALAAEVEALLRLVGDDKGAGAWPIKALRIASPLPDRVTVPPSARQTDKLARAVARHFAPVLALTTERLDWFENRCKRSAPTSVATVRQPEAEADRQPLELLHKAGKSKFS